jgi:hypothetical protein
LGTVRVSGGVLGRQLELDLRADQPLLSAIVEIPLDPLSDAISAGRRARLRCWRRSTMIPACGR